MGNISHSKRHSSPAVAFLKNRHKMIALCWATGLSFCDQQRSASDIDPGLGIECFECHSASLPPGTQYEGIGKLVENRLTITIMRVLGGGAGLPAEPGRDSTGVGKSLSLVV